MKDKKDYVKLNTKTSIILNDSLLDEIEEYRATIRPIPTRSDAIKMILNKFFKESKKEKIPIQKEPKKENILIVKESKEAKKINIPIVTDTIKVGSIK